MRGSEHDRLWNQLEAEIHLHRHKTVIRACRGRGKAKNLPVPPGHDRNALKKYKGVGQLRKVKLVKEPHEGLGISITVRMKFLLGLDDLNRIDISLGQLGLLL